MSKKAFDKIAAGFEDAIAFARGDTGDAVIHKPMDVKAVRAGTKKSQQAFAAAYRIPVGTLRDWEQGRRQPDAPARTLLTMIQADPVAVENLLMKA